MNTIRFLALLTVLAATGCIAAEVISWEPSPSSDTATGYKIYWSSNAGLAKPWPVLGTTPASVLSITNTAAGRFYYYITATNQFGESDPTDVAYRPGNPNNPKVK